MASPSQAKLIYVSVDIEAAGPYPPEFSMLQIGACDAFRPDLTFTRNLKPINDNVDEAALAVSGLPFEELKTTGTDPKAAMTAFADWLASLGPPEQKRVMIGQAVPFDWQFINYYFRKFAGDNPLGFTGIDNKALFMGATGCQWDKTGARAMDRVLGTTHAKTHDGLDDALYQAELFRGILKLAKGKRSEVGLD
jgi:DNA polymerase III epsilon subunit-like protein